MKASKAWRQRGGGGGNADDARDRARRAAGRAVALKEKLKAILMSNNSEGNSGSEVI